MKKILFLPVLSLFAAFAAPMPGSCPNCGSKDSLRPVAYGTIQQENEAGGRFFCTASPIHSENHGCIECRFTYSPGKAILPSLSIAVIGREFTSLTAVPEGTEILVIDGKIREKITEITIQKVKNATLTNDAFSGKNLLLITLLPEDSENFARLTRTYQGRQTAIYLLGHCMGTPMIFEPICNGKFQISGMENSPDLRKAVNWLNFRAQ